jgi:polysaccharide export outer membrane protein
MFFAIIALLFSSCQSSQPPTVADPPDSVAVRTPVTLAPGDIIKFSFPGAPELNQSQKVRADGRVSLPLIGEVYARGKTPGGLQAELGELYKSQLKNNSVVVTLENTSALLYVSGAVLKPGKVVVDRPMTVFEAIMEAGGFDPDFANPKKVIVLRRENGQQTSRTIDLSPALKGKPFGAYYVRAYDVIYVPQRLF